MSVLKGSPGSSGAGSIIRNEHGQMIGAFVMSTNMTEAIKLKTGIEWCISLI